MSAALVILIACLQARAVLARRDEIAYAGKVAPRDVESLLKDRGVSRATLQELADIAQVRNGSQTFCSGATPCVSPTNTSSQRMTASSSREAFCHKGQWQSGGLVFPCQKTPGQGPFWGRDPLSIPGWETMTLQVVPAGVKNLAVTIRQFYGDGDLYLFDATNGQPIIGYDSPICGYVGCVNKEYKGMLLNFNGDRNAWMWSPIEMLHIPGVTTVPLIIATFAWLWDFLGEVSYTYDGIKPCPEVPPGCSKCSWYGGCPTGTVPVCDGTAQVSCVAK